MKKVLLLIAFVALVASVNAQNFQAKTYYRYTGVAGDTAVSGTNKSITWFVPQEKLYLYQVQADIDETTGSASAIVILYGSNDNVNYSEIDTLATTFTGTEAQTADGIVGIQDLTTGVAWRYLKATLILSTTGTWHYNYLIFRAVAKND